MAHSRRGHTSQGRIHRNQIHDARGLLHDLPRKKSKWRPALWSIITIIHKNLRKIYGTNEKKERRACLSGRFVEKHHPPPSSPFTQEKKINFLYPLVLTKCLSHGGYEVARRKIWISWVWSKTSWKKYWKLGYSGYYPDYQIKLHIMTKTNVDDRKSLWEINHTGSSLRCVSGSIPYAQLRNSSGTDKQSIFI